MEILQNLGLDYTVVLNGVALSALLVILLYRRFLLSPFEPLTLFMMTQVGIASVMWAVPLEPSYKWQFYCYMLCLWAGFALKGKPQNSGTVVTFDQNALWDLKFILTVMCLLIVGANLYLGVTAGFPLLSLNPTEAKFTVYSGGLGFVRRINMGPYYLFCAGCSLLIVANQSRRYILGILAAGTSLVLLGGGKSVLLPLILTMSFVILHKGVCPSDRLRKTARRYVFVLLGAGISIALFVLTKEQDGFVAGIQGLLLRLLLAGDVIVFYYPRREIVMSLIDPSVTGYLHSIFADVLGLIRLGEYQPVALGSAILGSDVGGPNVQYFIHADLFFGPVAGGIYSFVVGYACAMLRNSFFSHRTKSIVWFSVRLFLAVVTFDLAMEAGMFVTEVFVALIFFLPLYLLARLCRTGLAKTDLLFLNARNPGTDRISL